MTRYAVVDLETTGHTPKSGDQIIEVGIVIIEDGAIIEEFSSYVNPGKEIPLFISNLTGITDRAVENAPSFKTVAKKIQALCKGAYFVAHHVQFDLVFLNDALMQEGLEPVNEKVIDTVELARIFTPRASGFKLSQLAEYYNINHMHPHRALSDAYVTAQLLLKLLQKAKSLPAKTLEQILYLEPKLQSDLHDILAELIHSKRYSMDQDQTYETFQGIVLKKAREEKNIASSLSLSFEDFLHGILGKKGTLSELYENYEVRDSQGEMAELIYRAFQENKHALIEAETGTGKTLAYLIPSIYHALQTGNRVLISTYTTQLQSQALHKEIPLLKNAINAPFQSVVMKGKRHYLSLKRFSEELQKSPEQDNYDVILTKALLLVWITETDTGDMDELQLPSSGYIFWRKINAEAEGLMDPKSSWFHHNYYTKVRKQAQKAQLVITNHSLLSTEIANNYNLLPSFDYCVIDEAHHFEKAASSHFGAKLSYVSIQYLLNEMKEEIQEAKFEELLTETKERADELFRYLFSIVKQKQDATYNDVGRIQSLFELKNITEPIRTQLVDLTQRLQFSLLDIMEYLEERMKKKESADAKNYVDKWKYHLESIHELKQKLHLFLRDEESAFVKWIEIEAQGAKNAVYLYCEPYEIGSALAEKFYHIKKSIILTSATLTMKNSFRYMLQKNGLEDGNVWTKQIASPFSIKDQVKLFVPNDLPHIKYDREEDYVTAISYAIYELAQITKGRMLVLFTSYQMLKNTHEMLVQFADQDDLVIIAQGISSGSRERLKKNFQTFDRAILLGTSSFWEGIDIPGEDLSAVVIVRLPFEPPNHPVYSAKAKMLKEQNKNPFMELALPNAVIRFKQGFGRLIRSKQDSGIVFVCDARLIQSKYGQYFLESIPDVPVIYDDTNHLFDLAREWYENR
ncbi:ATP-dependent DNA helicase DinG [Salirhabdus sp. Marseille-P4669]|uniref:ATP-dependent DNA helicase DinG n=1 Tax=Salirhabdus sp. Marseille-P4669 TaxID=2042310 RepID=UPI000C7C2DF6|nr:ATP-dependent DNA helicase DinG [Salirhabdus sp. Marseille-P4669]